MRNLGRRNNIRASGFSSKSWSCLALAAYMFVWYYTTEDWVSPTGCSHQEACLDNCYNSWGHLSQPGFAQDVRGLSKSQSLQGQVTPNDPRQLFSCFEIGCFCYVSASRTMRIALVENSVSILKISVLNLPCWGPHYVTPRGSPSISLPRTRGEDVKLHLTTGPTIRHLGRRD